MGTRNGRVRRTLAWSGLALMIASVIWWEAEPRGLRIAGPNKDGEMLRGPITRIVIDAGHGGNDSGALHGGVMEKELTLDVARRLDQLLRARGMATILTRSGDETISLSNRAALANREDDCIFVSIHFDEGARAAATGVQTFYAARQKTRAPLLASWFSFLRPATTESSNLESQSLAGFVQEQLVAQTKAVDRGIRAEQFYVVTNVWHPAVLVEGGFLSNEADLARLTTEGYRQQLAAAIGEGVLRYRKTAGQSNITAGATGGGR
ncbi:MAG: N-acetylmuramoyl-L-alanine amidase [Chthoniobacterales bacterium]